MNIILTLRFALQLSQISEYTLLNIVRFKYQPWLNSENPEYNERFCLAVQRLNKFLFQNNTDIFSFIKQIREGNFNAYPIQKMEVINDNL